MFDKFRTSYEQRLSFKFLAITALIVGSSFIFLFIWLSSRQEEHIMEQVRKQAVILHKQLVLTRQWVADHQSVLVAKSTNVGSSPYLKIPDINSVDGKTYTRISPSIMTRMLAERAEKGGLYSFKITNSERINPGNAPDEFENAALKTFRNTSAQGIFKTETLGSKAVMRYVAPVYVEDSCIKCHPQQYYKPGEVGGCLSVFIPMDDARQAIFNNRLVLFGGMTGLALSVLGLLHVGARSIVFSRIQEIKSAISSMDKEGIDSRKTAQGDELKEISDFCYLLNEKLKDQHEDLERKIDEATKELSETNKNHESALARLQVLNQAKLDFFSDISHELRTPLTNIKGAVDILTRKASCDNPEYLGMIKRNTEYLIKTVLDFLDYSKIENGQLELHRQPHSLTPIIHDAALAQKAQAVTKGVSLEVVETPDVEVDIDRDGIYKVLVNLLDNAIKFSPANDKVTIRIIHNHDFVKVTVKDNGPGVPEEYQSAVFQKFYQIIDHNRIHKGSAGIGLAICRGIIEAHDGRIWIDDAGEKGASFVFTLPITGSQSRGSYEQS